MFLQYVVETNSVTSQSVRVYLIVDDITGGVDLLSRNDSSVSFVIFHTVVSPL